MDLRLNHINIEGLTTETLMDDMKKRMAESRGAPVLYPYETVEALLAKIDDLGTAMVLIRSQLAQAAMALPEATTIEKRQRVLAHVHAALGVINVQIGKPPGTNSTN
jgi:hypothetical protein